MVETPTREWVITTNPARCRDCYRCVRMCHVKAIRVDNGQAQIVPELCVGCGNCITACPQGAKSVRDDLPAIQSAIRAGRMVVACLDPAAQTFFDLQDLDRFKAIFRSLGFTAVGEATGGAEMVGRAYWDFVGQHRNLWPIITSSCPVVVSQIEKYYPELIPHLAPLVSPMIARGRILRQFYGANAYIVYIGPCIAKKEEARGEVAEGSIDGVLTFRELLDWILVENIVSDTADLLAQPILENTLHQYTVEGGLIGTTNWDINTLTSHIVATSGLEGCEEVLRGIRAHQIDACSAELLACNGNCMSSMVFEMAGTVSITRQRIAMSAPYQLTQRLAEQTEWPDLSRVYHDKKMPIRQYAEEQIQDALNLVEKYTPDDELNCGACGYSTCREKAVATLRGMAEATMCIPYMRRRSESLRQVVMDVTPNAILIVDEHLYLHELSPSAEKLLGCRRASCVGKPLTDIMPVVDGLVRVRDLGQPVMGETIKLRDGLIVEQTIVPVKKHNLLLAILRDVTEREQQRTNLEHLRTEMLTRTQEVVNRQMRVAHEIAQLLGETTAESKVMLSRLATLIKED
ncbi:MAG: [Fe-Fe] hydrogenase large subunit C-terminal domain-containing protein [Anaerolineae bacterium]